MTATSLQMGTLRQNVHDRDALRAAGTHSTCTNLWARFGAWVSRLFTKTRERLIWPDTVIKFFNEVLA